MHTQPCGEYLSSFTAFVSISKLFAKICPVKKQDQSIGLGGRTIQMSSLKHSKNTKNTHIL